MKTTSNREGKCLAKYRGHICVRLHGHEYGHSCICSDFWPLNHAYNEGKDGVCTVCGSTLDEPWHLRQAA